MYVRSVAAWSQLSIRSVSATRGCTKLPFLPPTMTRILVMGSVRLRYGLDL